MVERMPFSESGWSRYASAVREAQFLCNTPVQVYDDSAAGYVHSDEEPPLSPEEEEALELGTASFGGQSALF